VCVCVRVYVCARVCVYTGRCTLLLRIINPKNEVSFSVTSFIPTVLTVQYAKKNIQQTFTKL